MTEAPDATPADDAEGDTQFGVSSEGGVGRGERLDDRAASAAEKWGTGASGDISLGDERPHGESGPYGSDRAFDEDDAENHLGS